ncbi:MAG TPA: 50S ribosomal protein L7Ae-like protein [Clostridiales bacterium UBA8153]|nr:50S ribosomal protein L7Ae-like protein [Clostridiales bacterium UBA8153]
MGDTLVAERLKAAKRRTVGTKQTLKAVERGQARVVVFAQDADERVLQELAELSRERGIEVVYIESMVALGKACGIQVGAASAAIIEG